MSVISVSAASAAESEMRMFGEPSPPVDDDAPFDGSPPGCNPLIEPGCIPVVPKPSPGGTDSIDDDKMIFAPDSRWEGDAGFGQQLRP
jgi:hypothetical protein